MCVGRISFLTSRQSPAMGGRIVQPSCGSDDLRWKTEMRNLRGAACWLHQVRRWKVVHEGIVLVKRIGGLGGGGLVMYIPGR